VKLDQFLDRLDKTHRSGNGYEARCPSHEDMVTSLCIAENGNKLLVHCQAGCQTEDVVAALGLTMRDLFYDSGREEPEAVYEYKNDHGELLYEVLRFPGKKFRQRRCDPETRELLWGLDGTHRVLYRLPEVIYAVEQGHTVYVCEGEKDVEALRAVGKAATCNAGGAGSWKSDYSDYLRGAKVIIVADKDDPGMDHARKVARSLDGIAKSVHVVQAKTGKDAADHLAAGHSVEEFVQITLTDAKLHYQPLNLFRPVPSVDWVVENVVVGGEATLLIADGGAGKSFFALAMSLAVASGEPFIGCKVRQGDVIYDDEEGSPDLALQRLAQLGATDEQKRRLHYLNFAGVDMVKHPERLIEDAKQIKPALIVIDSHSKVSRNASDENSNTELGRVWDDGFLKLARETKAAVLVIHHTNGSGGSRGASQIRNSADQALTMQKQPDGSQIVYASKPRRLTNRIHFEFQDCGNGRYALVPFGQQAEEVPPEWSEWSYQ
jgi:putative DNA primase/helicase